MIGWWLLLAMILTPVVAWLCRATERPSENLDKLRGRRLLSPRELANFQASSPPEESVEVTEEGENEDEEEQP